MADQPDTPMQPAPADPTSSSAGLSWQASEYIHHQKPASWHLGFFIIAIGTAGLLYLILHDLTAVIVVVLMFAALFVYAVRQPDTLEYQVGENGLSIGQKHYTYDRFRSFSVVQSAGIPSIVFEPLQRFSPAISIFCSPEQLEAIVNVLTQYLPRADRQPDVVDRLMHKLRF